jgi:hypothetical protein
MADDTVICYHGHRLSLRRLARPEKVGEQPPMEAKIVVLLDRCALGQRNHGTGKIELCARWIQISQGLAPCAVICPYCFGITRVTRARDTLYQDADKTAELSDGQVGSFLRSCHGTGLWYAS